MQFQLFLFLPPLSLKLVFSLLLFTETILNLVHQHNLHALTGHVNVINKYNLAEICNL